jgi:hypothetical protein
MVKKTSHEGSLLTPSGTNTPQTETVDVVDNTYMEQRCEMNFMDCLKEDDKTEKQRMEGTGVTQETEGLPTAFTFEDKE